MKFETEVYKIPSYALPYLINGDSSGLEESEVKTIDSWYESRGFNGYTIINPVQDESFFTATPAFGLPCDVVECEFLIPVKGNDSPAAESYHKEWCALNHGGSDCTCGEESSHE